MLARLSKVALERAPSAKKAQIKRRGYASIPRRVGDNSFIPQTTILDKVLSNAEGHKTLAQAYKEVTESQNNFRNEMLNQLNSAITESPFAAERSAASDLASAIGDIASKAPIDVAKFNLPTQNMDDMLQVHELGELYSQYAKAFAQLPYVPETGTVPVDSVIETFAPADAHIKATIQAITRLEQSIQIHANAAHKNAADLMYAQADDILAAHPEIEAQLDQEIVDNRWDLLVKDEA